MTGLDKKFYSPGWRASIIRQSDTITDALKAITNSGALMACICQDDGKLLGIVTDSDLRRALLNGAPLNSSVQAHVNDNPVLGYVTATKEDLLSIAIKSSVREIPLIDREGKLADIFLLTYHEDLEAGGIPESLNSEQTDCPMLILAGGRGTRLRSVVSDRPKPLAIVGSKPILETLIENAFKSGIRKFYVAVNYMSEQIVKHLQGDQYSHLDITILYEEEQLGTAGALSLIEEPLKKPLLICNADVLTKAGFANLARHHMKEDAALTCCVRPYDLVVPFGVFDINDGLITGVQEKPKYQFLLNAGIYALHPALVELVPKGRRYDMPDLIAEVCRLGKKVSPFFLHEYWIDVGQPEDYFKANKEFHLHFDRINPNL